eukprot:373377-Rhodomonas_salina.1
MVLLVVGDSPDQRRVVDDRAEEAQAAGVAVAAEVQHSRLEESDVEHQLVRAREAVSHKPHPRAKRLRPFCHHEVAFHRLALLPQLQLHGRRVVSPDEQH